MFFWAVAFILTLILAVYQRMTGPTYPLSGKATVDGVEVSYAFDRSHGGNSNHPVRVRTGSSHVDGLMEWRRFRSKETWTTVAMHYGHDTLFAELPWQPAAGKLEYQLHLRTARESVLIPGDGPVIIRFKGDVPAFILVPHIIAMFGAMLLSTRTGLECFSATPRLKGLTCWTLGFLTVGGMILGPVVQKFAFGAFWTGWPFGTDLTDNKTFFALLGWVAAAVALYRSSRPRRWVLGAALLLIVVFLIPHSLLGSEFESTPGERQPSLVSPEKQ
jgi:hypothetical protein